MTTNMPNTDNKTEGAVDVSSTRLLDGFWRSPTGENHGRDSRPGDVWVKPGDITDTDRLNWLIAHGYTPAKWRPWKPGDPESLNGGTMVGWGGREEIDAAILRPSNTKSDSR